MCRVSEEEIRKLGGRRGRVDGVVEGSVKGVLGSRGNGEGG